jgi:hypothetical protein
MARQKMWWAKSNWWWNHGVSAQNDGNWIVLTGRDTDNWSNDLFVSHDVFKIVGQFGMGRSRMPSSGRTFVSAPRAHFDGSVQARTGGDDCFLFWCDEPSAVVSFIGTQYIENGRSYTSGPKTETIARIDNAEHRNDIVSPHRFDFKPKEFVLNRRHPLRIKLEFRIRTYVKGDAEVDFDHFQHDPFRLTLPQWWVRSVT